MRSNSATIMPIAATAAAVQRRACGSHPLEKNLAAAVVAVAVAVAVGVGVVVVVVVVVGCWLLVVGGCCCCCCFM